MADNNCNDAHYIQELAVKHGVNYESASKIWFKRTESERIKLRNKSDLAREIAPNPNFEVDKFIDGLDRGGRSGLRYKSPAKTFMDTDQVSPTRMGDRGNNVSITSPSRRKLYTDCTSQSGQSTQSMNNSQTNFQARCSTPTRRMSPMRASPSRCSTQARCASPARYTTNISTPLNTGGSDQSVTCMSNLKQRLMQQDGNIPTVSETLQPKSCEVASYEAEIAAIEQQRKDLEARKKEAEEADRMARLERERCEEAQKKAVLQDIASKYRSLDFVKEKLDDITIVYLDAPPFNSEAVFNESDISFEGSTKVNVVNNGVAANMLFAGRYYVRSVVCKNLSIVNLIFNNFYYENRSMKKEEFDNYFLFLKDPLMYQIVYTGIIFYNDPNFFSRTNLLIRSKDFGGKTLNDTIASLPDFVSSNALAALPTDSIKNKKLTGKDVCDLYNLWKWFNDALNVKGASSVLDPYVTATVSNSEFYSIVVCYLFMYTQYFMTNDKLGLNKGDDLFKNGITISRSLMKSIQVQDPKIKLKVIDFIKWVAKYVNAIATLDKTIASALLSV